jgi:hypothetical protein
MTAKPREVSGFVRGTVEAAIRKFIAFTECSRELPEEPTSRVVFGRQSGQRRLEQKYKGSEGKRDSVHLAA